jgi:uroporphyrinogen III methyltransferase/synthase
MSKGAQVYFVGAGPGNPGLLTLRGAECLSRADLIIHDRLVPPRILDYAPEAAERICVADLPGPHPEKSSQIHSLLIEAAGQGKCVVRLKGGDPLLFARGGEELQAVREAGILYEIVPGVTAGLAAAAFAGIPLTHRFHASAVAFLTGHEDPEKPDNNLDWAALARFPGTLIIYMGMARVSQIAQSLMRHGKSGTTATAVIEWGSISTQRTIQTRLADLPEVARVHQLKAPSVIVIGSVVDLRSKLSWFENLPLFGRHILITRPREQAGDLARRLEELGAFISIWSVVRIGEPDEWKPVDQALMNVHTYNWLVFTSANGVHALVRRLREIGRDLRALGSLKLAAIGPQTAASLREYHLEPDVVPPSFRSESLADELREKVAGQRVLLARADRGRELLRDELSKLADVDQIAVYSQSDTVDAPPQILSSLEKGEIDYVALTSSNIARSFLGAISEESRQRILSGETKLVSISPITSQTIRSMGAPVAGEAADYTSQGIIDALVKLAPRNEK